MCRAGRSALRGCHSWATLRIKSAQSKATEPLGNRAVSSKKLEATLSIVRDYNRALLETVRSPVIVADEDLIIQLVNRAFCRTFDVERSNVENRGLTEWNGAFGHNSVIGPRIADVLTKKKALQDFRAELPAQNGEKTRFLVNARHVDSHEGKPLVLISLEPLGEPI